MGKNGLSATDIGNTYGLVPRAANRLLEIAGVHEKVDGGWKPTELGERFIDVVYEHNGHGGYASRGWDKTYFSPDLLDELNITPEMVAEARTVYAADLAADALKRAAGKAEAEEHFRQFQEKLAREAQESAQEFEVDWKKVAVLLGGAIVVVGGTVVVVKYGPAIKRTWQAKVTPQLDAAKRKLLRRPAESEDGRHSATSE